MTSAEPVWKETPWHYRDALVDEPALGCYLAKVFCWHASRNAWHSTQSGEHGGYSLNRESVQEDVDGRRKRGTTFTILELPAISIMGKAQDLVIFESYRTMAPFTETQGLEITGNSWEHLCRSICSVAPYPSSYKRYYASRGYARVPILPYKTFEALSQGTGWPYIWLPSGQRSPDITHIASLVNRICVHLNGRG